MNFTFAFLAGCALFVPREEVSLKQATVEELTALLSQREAAIQTMKGLFSAKVRGGIIPIASRVEGALYYRRPNAMRLRGFTAVGSELFEFVQADDQFRLRLPTMGRVLSGSPSDMSEMGKLARPFQLSVWAMGGVLGTGTIVKNETVALVEEGDRYRLDVFGPSPNGAQLMRRRLWFERQTLLVVREDRLTESGAVEATIQYEDFRTIGEAEAISSAGDRRLLRPFKIVLEDGKGQGSVQITFHEMIPNLPLKATDLGQVSQDAEKVRQRRSRIVQTLNVPQRVRLGPSLAAALLDELFEHPARVFICCATRAAPRSSSVPT